MPPREGEAWIGFDPGAVRVHFRQPAQCGPMAAPSSTQHVPAIPSLAERGSADGCGGLYVQAADRAMSSARTREGSRRYATFLAAVIHDLAGVEIMGGGSDQYRRAEVEQVLDDPATGVEFDWSFRRMGSAAHKVQTMFAPSKPFC